MRYWLLMMPAVLLVSWVGQARSQQSQKPTEQPRAVKAFDPAAIRRQAAQIAELRASLADPDPTVRLLTIQEAIANGDPTQRDLAVEAGLASNESLMIEAALRGIMVNTRQVIMEVLDEDRKVSTPNTTSDQRLTVESFDVNTGRAGGKIYCGGEREWSGQLQGVTFSFNDKSFICGGTLSWVSETGDFRGRITIYPGHARNSRNVVWKPR